MALVVVLAPMRTELTPVVRRLGLRRDRSAPGDRPRWSGRCGGAEVVAAVAGVGTAHAAAVAEAVIAAVAPDHVVVAGVAGGLAPHLRVGDVVVPEVVEDLDEGTSHRAHQLGERIPEGRLLTSTVMHGWDVLAAHAADGALAIDMETAAIAAVCDAADVPWTAIRALSDVVREGTVDESTLDLVREDGETDLGAVARLLVRHPLRVRALAAMGRDSSAATRAVAGELERALHGGSGDQASGIGADAR